MFTDLRHGTESYPAPEPGTGAGLSGAPPTETGPKGLGLGEAIFHRAPRSVRLRRQQGELTGYSFQNPRAANDSHSCVVEASRYAPIPSTAKTFRRRSQIRRKWLRSSVNVWLIQALKSNRPKVPKRGRNHKVGNLVADIEKMSLSELAALEADVVRQVTAGPIAPQGADSIFDGEEKRMRALKREISSH